MDKFPVFIERLLGHEGGYVNNPKDPGGETKWGISKRSYPGVDIRNLTRDQAIAIYRRDFWDAAGLGDLPPVVGFQLLDAAVNSGLYRGTKWLQQAARVTVDGKIGPKTRAAVLTMDPNDVVFRLAAFRQLFIADQSDEWWREFGRGLTRRLANNLLFAAEDN